MSSPKKLSFYSDPHLSFSQRTATEKDDYEYQDPGPHVSFLRQVETP